MSSRAGARRTKRNLVAVICDGLDLPVLGAASQDIRTVVVLLAAVTIDTVARRSRGST